MILLTVIQAQFRLWSENPKHVCLCCGPLQSHQKMCFSQNLVHVMFQNLERRIGVAFWDLKCIFTSHSPLTEAVLVQLYKMASSPNARPECIVPSTTESLDTSISPSVMPQELVMRQKYLVGANLAMAPLTQARISSSWLTLLRAFIQQMKLRNARKIISPVYCDIPKRLASYVLPVRPRSCPTVDVHIFSFAWGRPMQDLDTCLKHHVAFSTVALRTERVVPKTKSRCLEKEVFKPAETYRCCPASPSLMMKCPSLNRFAYMQSTISRTCVLPKFLRKSLFRIASLINCFDLKVETKQWLG